MKYTKRVLLCSLGATLSMPVFSQGGVLWRNNSTGLNYLYLLDGTSITQQLALNTVSDPNWQVACSGDFNHDGETDVLWRNHDSGVNYIYLLNQHSITTQYALNINRVKTAYE